MNINYTENFSLDEQNLRIFLESSGFENGVELDKIVKAIINSNNIVAFDENSNKLAAIINILADGSYAAYIQFMVVAPEYRGKGINDELIKLTLEKYKEYSKIINLAQDDFHAGFFTKMGFKKSDEIVLKA